MSGDSLPYKSAPWFFAGIGISILGGLIAVLPLIDGANSTASSGGSANSSGAGMYWAIGAVISAIGSLSVIVALGIALRNLDFLALRAWGYDNSDPDRAASPD